MNASKVGMPSWRAQLLNNFLVLVPDPAGYEGQAALGMRIGLCKIEAKKYFWMRHSKVILLILVFFCTSHVREMFDNMF